LRLSPHPNRSRVRLADASGPDGARSHSLSNPAWTGAASRHYPSHVNRILKGLCGIGPDLCLRLADVLAESRATALRQCGHAKLPERVYPQGDPEPMHPRVLDTIERLSDHDQQSISVLVERLASTTQDGDR
jgi:hypothetical protein